MSSGTSRNLRGEALVCGRVVCTNVLETNRSQIHVGLFVNFNFGLSISINLRFRSVFKSNLQHAVQRKEDYDTTEETESLFFELLPILWVPNEL